MNSRDAAYDEMEMMALLADSAAEAAAGIAVQSSSSPVNGSVNGLADVDEQVPSPATTKKKRKRGSEDAFVTLTLVLLASLNLLLSAAHQRGHTSNDTQVHLNAGSPSASCEE